VSTVYFYPIHRRKAWESYRQEGIGLLLGGGSRKRWEIPSNIEKMGKRPLPHTTTSA